MTGSQHGQLHAKQRSVLARRMALRSGALTAGVAGSRGSASSGIAVLRGAIAPVSLYCPGGSRLGSSKTITDSLSPISAS